MLGGADNPNGELLSIIGADSHPALLMFPRFADIFQQGNLLA